MNADQQRLNHDGHDELRIRRLRRLIFDPNG
jgi:hypothetical protein